MQKINIESEHTVEQLTPSIGHGNPEIEASFLAKFGHRIKMMILVVMTFDHCCVLASYSAGYTIVIFIKLPNLLIHISSLKVNLEDTTESVY